MNQQLLENIQSIQERINVAATKSGRAASDVLFVAVTKYLDVETTGLLVDAGHVVLGESRPQVLWSKAKHFAKRDVKWHMIGHLQRNKANRTVPLCSMIHSVDSLRLLESIQQISAANESVANCLLEVNVSGEEAKHGLLPDKLEAVLERASEMDAVRIDGLMGMASLRGDAEENRAEFAELRKLRDRLDVETENIKLKELSMGMSGDFEAAIEEGSTMVRIGSVLYEGCQFG